MDNYSEEIKELFNRVYDEEIIEIFKFPHSPLYNIITKNDVYVATVVENKYIHITHIKEITK